MDYVKDSLAALPAELVVEAQKRFDGQDPAHDWQHNLRVMAMCERIGREEGADMEVLRLAALLHDIGRAEERQTGECHAEISARLAGEWLAERSMTEAFILRVQSAILAHRFRKERPPHTLEEKILFDADKLDSIGAIGVARVFAYTGVIGQPIQSDDPNQHTPYKEYTWKLQRIKDKLFTKTAQQIAEDRHRFMTMFFEQWEWEVTGIR
ncbi:MULTISPECIES: HD domain-containing protein [Brevibacillus]|uniref:HD domain-containing protein n=1 Tax=Brevibacillus TaxID=55080 RepID=UPI000D0F28AC|nr:MULTISPECIES: HD domain-containing protein [Brevibacillus]MBW5468654.1 HD domain-containing protein [Brevibacillus formosus]MED1944642.1 HD domain-containing protein [Brevibacillus formosus]MED1996671.1 HD domain-containing protein [Brevibacillus formosus]MED2081640.1 HD domain-containing protein [Brevibacillus formosus]PSK12422.1 HD domain-containing protein [Brevibacillus sp. NRRL NRS-603]